MPEDDIIGLQTGLKDCYVTAMIYTNLKFDLIDI